MNKRMFGKYLLAGTALTLAMLPKIAPAVVDLSNAANAVTFATELINANPHEVVNAGNALDASSPLGFSIATGTSKYVRFSLSNGATFSAVPTYTINAADNNAADTIVLSAGGNGASYVIFEVGDSANGINPTAVGTLASAQFMVTSASSVTMSYGLYGTAGEAVGQTSPLSTQSTGFLSFASGIAVNAVAVNENVIDVLQNSTMFTTTYAGDKFHTTIGSIDINAVTTVRDPNDGAVLADPADLAQLVAASANITVTGDFSATRNDDNTYTGTALGRVYIDEGAASDCTVKDFNAATLTATTAVFNVAQNDLDAGSLLCMIAEGTPEIVPVTFDALYDTGTGGLAADVSLNDIGTLAKNSKALQSPWLSNTSGFATRFVLTNTGVNDVDFQTTVYTEAGTTATLKAPYTGLATIPAGESKSIEVADLVTLAGGTKAAVVFDILGTSSTVMGYYHFYNRSTGLMVVLPLARPNVD